AERTVRESRSKLSESEVSEIETKTKELRDLLARDDASAEAIRAKTDELTRALHAVAQKLYQSTPPPSGPSGPAGETGPTDAESPAGGSTPPNGASAVDADFKVVDSGEAPDHP
ncbi:Heat shock protein 70, partial [mine drainage metagenome]